MISEMVFFQYIAHRFESWIKFLGPVWEKLQQNVFDDDTKPLPEPMLTYH